MSKRVKIELNSKGVGELLKSQEMREECERVAQSQASSNQHIKSFVGWQRAVAMIYPDTKKHP